MKGLIYTKIGLNKGTHRFWVEGSKLAINGLLPDTMTTRKFDVRNQRVVIKVASGEPNKHMRKVSKKTKGGIRIPVLDIQNKALAALFRVGQHVVASVKKGSVIITAVVAYSIFSGHAQAASEASDITTGHISHFTSNNQPHVMHLPSDLDKPGNIFFMMNEVQKHRPAMLSLLTVPQHPRIAAVAGIARNLGYTTVINKLAGSMVAYHNQYPALESKAAQIPASRSDHNPSQSLLNNFNPKFIPSLKVGSLFHGAGILDHASHQGLSQHIDTQISYIVEMDSDYIDCSLRNNPSLDNKTQWVNSDVSVVEMHKLSTANFILAGIPCTGASSAGRSKNKLEQAEDHMFAGGMFYFFLNHIIHNQALGALYENVPNYAKTQSAQIIQETLSLFGYKLHQHTLKGGEHGAIENRERIAVAITHKNLTSRTPALDIQKQPNTKRLGDILEAIDLESSQWKDTSYLTKKAARDKLKGNCFKRNLVSATDKSIGCVGRLYAKIRSTEPHIPHPYKPEFTRLLTVNEHLKAKTIPPFLIQNVSATIGHELAGQSCIHDAFVNTLSAYGKLIYGEQQYEHQLSLNSIWAA